MIRSGLMGAKVECKGPTQAEEKVVYVLRGTAEEISPGSSRQNPFAVLGTMGCGLTNQRGGENDGSEWVWCYYPSASTSWKAHIQIKLDFTKQLV